MQQKEAKQNKYLIQINSYFLNSKRTYEFENRNYALEVSNKNNTFE